MSVQPDRLIGRVAKLFGLVSKPELNDKLVILTGFLVSNQRFAASTFADLNSGLPAVSVSVKRTNLEFVTRSFDELYPSAVAVPGSYMYTNTIQPGTIVDFSRCPSAYSIPLIFPHACSVRGSPFQSGGSGRPTTFITAQVVVALENDTDIIEFEDINFNMEMRGGVKCANGKHIIFRRCQFFSGDDMGVMVAGSGTEVVFENCSFDNCAGSGVIVEDCSRATLINCTIRRTNFGIEIRNGGSAHLAHCMVSDTRQPCAVVHGKGRSLTMKYCSILDCKDSGILVADGGVINIDNCRIDHCSMAGIAVQGPSRSSAIITNTNISACEHGLLVQTGKSNVAVEDCTITNNNMYGLFVGQDAVGEVVVNNTTISGNRVRDVNNDGAGKSALVRDGRTLAQDGVMANLRRANPTKAKIVNEMTMDPRQNMANPGLKPILETVRARKMAGVGTVNCAACNKEEPPKVKFDKCARCLECCYCSRECQVGHWKQHKPDCKKRVQNPGLLDPSKSAF